jgi:hypothetical protein
MGPASWPSETDKRRQIMGNYEVWVGNVGMVHECAVELDALFCARQWVDASKSGSGRCANEPVWVHDPEGEVIAEYEPEYWTRE